MTKPFLGPAAQASSAADDLEGALEMIAGYTIIPEGGVRPDAASYVTAAEFAVEVQAIARKALARRGATSPHAPTQDVPVRVVGWLDGENRGVEVVPIDPNVDIDCSGRRAVLVLQGSGDEVATATPRGAQPELEGLSRVWLALAAFETSAYRWEDVAGFRVIPDALKDDYQRWAREIHAHVDEARAALRAAAVASAEEEMLADVIRLGLSSTDCRCSELKDGDDPCSSCSRIIAGRHAMTALRELHIAKRGLSRVWLALAAFETSANRWEDLADFRTIPDALGDDYRRWAREIRRHVSAAYAALRAAPPRAEEDILTVLIELGLSASDCRCGEVEDDNRCSSCNKTIAARHALNALLKPN